MRKKQQRRAPRERKAACAFIRQLQQLGVTLTLQEDGNIGCFSREPIPPLVALFIADNSEEIARALANERPGPLPYAPHGTCPDCKRPFVLAGEGGQEARFWRCGCHTLAEVKL